MGASNNLPVVPSFTAGAPSINQLNALSYAVSFLVDNDVRPAWSLFMYNGTQAISASTWTTVAYDHIAYDSDGVASGSGTPSLPVIVTQGYYAVTACVQVEATSGANDEYTAAFLFTAGGNNPHFTSGTTQYFGYKGGKMSSTAQAAADNATCLSDNVPMVLYPGDKLAVQVYPTAAKTIDYNENTSFIQGRFATKFTGHWVRAGS